MTTSYELSIKLHEKYPEMGKNSYWVWRKIGGLHSMIDPTGVFLETREDMIDNEGEWAYLCPAMTLGELVRTLPTGSICTMRVNGGLQSMIESAFRVCLNLRLHDDKLAPDVWGEADTPEDALGLAMLEGE